MVDIIGPLNGFTGLGHRLASNIKHGNELITLLQEVPVYFKGNCTYTFGTTTTVASTAAVEMHSSGVTEASATQEPTTYATLSPTMSLVAYINVLARPNVASNISGIGVTNNTTVANLTSTTAAVIRRKCIGIDSTGKVLAISSDATSISVIDTGIVVGTLGCQMQVYISDGSAFSVIVQDNNTAVTTKYSGNFGISPIGLGFVNVFKAQTASSSEVQVYGCPFLLFESGIP